MNQSFFYPEIAIYESETQSICVGTTTMQVAPGDATEDACSKRHDNWSSTAPDLWSNEEEEDE